MLCYPVFKRVFGFFCHCPKYQIPNKKYGDGTLEVTTRQSVEMQGVPDTNVDKLMAEVYASGLATIGMGYVSSCVGMDYCTEGLVETKKLAGKLTMAFAQQLTPHKMKISISGCPHEAAVEVKRGYTIWDRWQRCTKTW